MVGFSGLLFNKVLDPLYFFVFKKTMLVHWYPFGKKELNEDLRAVLQQHFNFYKALSSRQQSHFDHRVTKFLTKYQFIGNDIVVDQPMKTMVAGYYVMLTFGMRKYLVDNLDKIIIYPQKYYSQHTDVYHKGEYNRILKAVVLSWEDFLKGHQDDNDNVNLALHEFTHVLHWNALKSNEMSAIVFFDEFRELFQIYKNVSAMDEIRSKGYFRDYAYENQFEFLAVLLEHFFETPQVFKAEFPDLFERVRRMVNIDENLLHQKLSSLSGS